MGQVDVLSVSGLSKPVVICLIYKVYCPSHIGKENKIINDHIKCQRSGVKLFSL